MSAFSALPHVCQTILVVLMFTAMTGELLLLTYKISHAAPVRRCIRAGVIALSNFVLIIILRPYLFLEIPEGNAAFVLPWSIVAGLILFTILHLVYSFPKEKKRWDNCLTPQSVYEATNNLPMGVCFSNPYGRVILCNRNMRNLASQLVGSYPQMMTELTEALKAPPKKIELLPDGSLRFENGRIYQFCLSELTVDGEHGWHQLTAQVVTEQHRINEELAQKNEKLKTVNARLQDMYDRMTYTVREKENLDLKVYIHDTIGRSIITIRDIMESDDETEKKLESLREAVSVLSGGRSQLMDTVEGLRQTTAEIGVTVKLVGVVPAGSPAERLIVMAAKECATNCLRHAKGNAITVDIQELGGNYKVTITNNGEKPKGKITEGSGLSSLRLSVEAEDGTMHVSDYPEFALILYLREENEL